MLLLEGLLHLTILITPIIVLQYLTDPERCSISLDPQQESVGRMCKDFGGKDHEFESLHHVAT